MPRFLSAKPDARLIPLPWGTPLADWPTDVLVALPRGISRHVVRFVAVDDDVYAAKEVIEAAAFHEYRMLQDSTAWTPPPSNRWPSSRAARPRTASPSIRCS